jgi:hypothetical protein
MLESVLTGIAITIALFVVLAVIIYRRPGAFRIARSATIDGPPTAVFPHVNNLHAWEAWSPFEKLDPAMKRTYEGPASGVGAKQLWSGNGRAGQGSMTITDSQPNNFVRLRLDFLKPFKATNIAEFTFQPVGSGTEVTWAMSGTKNFVMKAFGLIMDMDKMLGSTFAEGLASLKKVSETGQPAIK